MSKLITNFYSSLKPNETLIITLPRKTGLGSALRFPNEALIKIKTF